MVIDLDYRDHASMSSTSGGLRGMVYLSIGIGIAAIIVAATAVYLSTSGILKQSTDEDRTDIAVIDQPPTEREFYLFTEVDENIDEVALGIPPDKFSLETIVVNKGDTVDIHFYNLEPTETQEKHSFTMATEGYQMHRDVEASQSVEIEFTADEAGVFEYECVYHTPTMKGKLVVLPVAR